MSLGFYVGGSVHQRHYQSNRISWLLECLLSSMTTIMLLCFFISDSTSRSTLYNYVRTYGGMFLCIYRGISYHCHSGSNLIHNKKFIVNPHAAKWLRYWAKPLYDPLPFAVACPLQKPLFNCDIGSIMTQNAICHMIQNFGGQRSWWIARDSPRLSCPKFSFLNLFLRIEAAIRCLAS